MQLLKDSEVSSLLRYELIYLATPYTKYPWGIEAAAEDAARITGRLIGQRLKIFSPIVHSHYICMATGIDPLDHEFWLEVDAAHMHKADALLVVRMSGWDMSSGVNKEIKIFDEAKKPIFGIEPGFKR
jgi:hypothetical protein